MSNILECQQFSESSDIVLCIFIMLHKKSTRRKTKLVVTNTMDCSCMFIKNKLIEKISWQTSYQYIEVNNDFIEEVKKK